MTSDKARKRAARALAAQAGVSYTAARRRLTQTQQLPDRPVSVPPPRGVDALREWYLDGRATWSPEQRAHEARRATRITTGRAWHLVDRYPSLRTAHYHGYVFGSDQMGNVLAVELLYLVALHEQPDLRPDPKHLAWVAELADTEPVDAACAELDRAARLVVDGDYDRLYRERIPAALEAATQSRDGQRRAQAQRVAAGFHQATKVPYGHNKAGFKLVRGVPIPAARQVLDATLTATAGGFAPGVLVDVVGGEHAGVTATVVGAEWAASGPPTGYVIYRGSPQPSPVVPAELVRLADS